MIIILVDSKFVYVVSPDANFCTSLYDLWVNLGQFKIVYFYIHENSIRYCIRYWSSLVGEVKIRILIFIRIQVNLNQLSDYHVSGNILL